MTEKLRKHEVCLGKIRGVQLEYRDSERKFTISMSLDGGEGTYVSAWEFPPIIAKALLNVLKLAVDKYESKYGEIEIDEIKIKDELLEDDST